MISFINIQIKIYKHKINNYDIFHLCGYYYISMLFFLNTYLMISIFYVKNYYLKINRINKTRHMKILRYDIQEYINKICLIIILFE